MAIRVEGNTVYVDSFAEAFEAAAKYPDVEDVVFNNQADYFTAVKVAKALNVK